MVSAETKKPEEPEEERTIYGNQLELILSLASYCVGPFNLWRFPHLAYENGGGSFLVPYLVAVMVLGFPLFVLELGLGQMLRQGPVNMWVRLGLPRLRGAGVAATWLTFVCSLYYVVIMAWSAFYLWEVIGALTSHTLPWEDGAQGFSCRVTVLVNESWLGTHGVARSDLFTSEDLFSPNHRGAFVCPAVGIPDDTTNLDEFAGNVTRETMAPTRCPSQAALWFWTDKALQRSAGITQLGGLNPRMLSCLTFVWICMFLSVFKGISVSGKIAIFTGILPSFCLILLFFQAVFLTNAEVGLFWYLTPDLSRLADGVVWRAAATQVFYSLGLGWGSITVFGSYASPHADCIGHAFKIVLINSWTSIFTGFVVFSTLGHLAYELSKVNPCFSPDDISQLEVIGVRGSGLAFVAFPIAIGQMGAGKMVFALLFFVLLFSMGLGTSFAYLENIVAVLHDSRLLRGWRRWKVAGVVCLVSYLLGLIFVTKAGDYWVTLFDAYVGAVTAFVVCLSECLALMWWSPSTYDNFQAKIEALTRRAVPPTVGFFLKWVGPCYMGTLLMFAFRLDLTGNANRGEEAFPDWALWTGWFVALLPILVGSTTLFFDPPELEYKASESLSNIDFLDRSDLLGKRTLGGTGRFRRLQPPREEPLGLYPHAR